METRQKNDLARTKAIRMPIEGKGRSEGRGGNPGPNSVRRITRAAKACRCGGREVDARNRDVPFEIRAHPIYRRIRFET